MTDALFGLLGVIVGGVLTGFVGIAVEHQRERRLARVAARVLREHLLDAMRAGEDQLAGRPNVLEASAQALLAAWEQERRTLATVMDYSPYSDVAEGVRAAGQAAALGLLTAQERERLAHLVAQIGAAAHELKALAAG